jgi:hypothetical protein
MLATAIANGTLGFVMLVTFCFCIGDVDQVVKSPVGSMCKGAPVSLIMPLLIGNRSFHPGLCQRNTVVKWSHCYDMHLDYLVNILLHHQHCNCFATAICLCKRPRIPFRQYFCLCAVRMGYSIGEQSTGESWIDPKIFVLIYRHLRTPSFLRSL